MKCADCGCQLEEGKLYCPQCGREIQMVPNFEPEIEASIQGAMAGVLETIAPEEALKAADDTSRTSEPGGEQSGKRRAKRRTGAKLNSHLAGAVASVIVILVVLIWMAISYRAQDVDYQLERAADCAQKEDYAGAVAYAEKAVELQTTNLEARNQLGEYYRKNQDTVAAKNVFLEVISMDAENETAYENLVAIYETEGDYEAVDSLIRASDSADIRNLFAKYIANPPQFSYEQGTYEEIIPLKLTANTSGKIYYTTDGSRPDETGELYKAPLFLETGIHTIKAIFVNDYGLRSEVATGIYQIQLDVPHEPEVKPAGGAYSSPQMISVQVPQGETVYYTVDGSVPTKDSLQYTTPMVMPMGNTVYKFISCSKDGAASEVVTCQYEFLYEAPVNVQEAVNLLVLGLKDRGILLENDGTVPGKSGHNIYICSTVIAINGNDYYLVVEYYEDLTGVDTRTGNLYCVDTVNGQLFKASMGADGYYSAVSF